VHFFNPAGLGGLESTVRWRVLSGCTDFETACRRADDLIPTSRSDEAERWDAKARLLLGLLLHAAAVSGRSMSDVRRWAPGDATALREVSDALIAAGFGGRDRLDEWEEHCRTNSKTKTSITTPMAAAVASVSNDRARHLGDAAPDDPRLIDPMRLIRAGETLHLIGGEGNTRFAPLIAALVAEIAHAARMLASHYPGGRLDPPLTMILDEADRVVPVALDKWTADMGGRGVTIHIAVQSLAQLRQRWGEDGAATICANAAALVIYGGSPAANDLRDISTLVGEHTAREVDKDGAVANRRVPVLSPAEIRALDPWQVLVLRRHLRPFVGWTPKVLDRRGWKPVTLSRPEALDALVAERDERISTGELEAIYTHEATGPDGSQGGRRTGWVGRQRGPATGVHEGPDREQVLREYGPQRSARPGSEDRDDSGLDDNDQAPGLNKPDGASDGPEYPGGVW
jgi:hypothetical protein